MGPASTRRVALGCLASAVLLVGGCGRPSGDATPIRYGFGPIHSAVLRKQLDGQSPDMAVERRIARCMADLGYDYAVPDSPDLLAALEATFGTVLIGHAEPDQLAVAHSEAYVLALNGPLDDEAPSVEHEAFGVAVVMPATGCRAAAENEVWGADRPDAFAARLFLGGVLSQLRQETFSSEDVESLGQDWSLCVQGRLDIATSVDSPFVFARSPDAEPSEATLGCTADVRLPERVLGLLAVRERTEMADAPVIAEAVKLLTSK